MKILLSIVFFGIILSQEGAAKANVSVENVIKSSFSNVTLVDAKQLILTQKQYDYVTKSAKAAIDTKIYRYYTIQSNNNIIGYGVLITRKVRTKKATILYTFNQNGKLVFSEIMAFDEPPEYIPNKRWMNQFSNADSSAQLTLGRDIPAISGATLSSRTISDGARIARALYNIIANKVSL